MYPLEKKLVSVVLMLPNNFVVRDNLRCLIKSSLNIRAQIDNINDDSPKTQHINIGISQSAILGRLSCICFTK